MKAIDYKNSLLEIYHALCALCDDVTPTNGYRYSNRRVLEFYNRVDYAINCIQRTIDTINPLYTYGNEHVQQVIETYKSKLEAYSRDWVPLKEYSKKVLPNQVYF